MQLLCKNCGAQLMGVEHACPVCGAPLNHNQTQQPGVPQVAPVIPTVQGPQPTPINPMEVHAEVTGQTGVPQQPVMMKPTPVVTQPTVNQTPPKEKKSIDRKTLIIIICIALVILLGIMVYSVVFAGNKEETKTPTPTTEEPTENPTEEPTVTNTVEYGGYIFTLPQGYHTTTSATYGLIISSDTEAYSIAVDYTNTYETYKAAFLQAYPNLASSIVSNIAGKEYVTMILQDPTNPTGPIATQYMAKKQDNVTFVGLVLRSDYTAPTTDEFINLNEILDTAQTGTQTVTPGSSEDAGVMLGVTTYTVDFNEFTFE